LAVSAGRIVNIRIYDDVMNIRIYDDEFARLAGLSEQFGVFSAKLRWVGLTLLRDLDADGGGEGGSRTDGVEPTLPLRAEQRRNRTLRTGSL